MRRSRAAGKSFPPSFCHDISGFGSPIAPQSKRAIFVAFIVILFGTILNIGKAVHGKII